ncbi:unnamed protein product, partial [Rotaria magnacalcarata]
KKQKLYCAIEQQIVLALKDGETPDVSDYRDFKIQAENIGYRLLEKFGWKEGHGL